MLKAKAKNIFDTLIYSPVFKIGLVIGAFSARMGWDSFTRHFMRLNARSVLFIRRAETKQDITDAGREWKRMFPASGMQEIISSDADTVYAEGDPCPMPPARQWRCKGLLQGDGIRPMPVGEDRRVVFCS